MAVSKYKPDDSDVLDGDGLNKLLEDLDLDAIPNIAQNNGWIYSPGQDRFLKGGTPVLHETVLEVINGEIDKAGKQICREFGKMFDDHPSQNNLVVIEIEALKKYQENIARILMRIMPMFLMLGLGGSPEELASRENLVKERLSEKFGWLAEQFRKIAQGKYTEAQIRATCRYKAQDMAQQYNQGREDLHDPAIWGWYRTILGKCRHCNQCPQEARKGWSDRFTLIPIGERECRFSCCCRYEYSDSLAKPENNLLMPLITDIGFGWVGKPVNHRLH